MKKSFSTILIITFHAFLVFMGCKKDSSSLTSIYSENSISKNISYSDFTKAIGSTNNLILKINKPAKTGQINSEVSVNSVTTDKSEYEYFTIDTSKIVFVKNNLHEEFYSMRLTMKSDSGNNCFYNLYVKKDSANKISQTIIKYIPSAETIKHNFKKFDAKYFILQSNMHDKKGDITTLVDNGYGCFEVFVEVACDNGYVHNQNGPGSWCDANGSYSFYAIDCSGAGGNTSSGSGNGSGSSSGGVQNNGSVLILPSNSNNSVIACEVPQTDQYINQLYYDNILWAYQHVNTFNQLCSSLCGNDSQTNKDEIQSTIDYLKAHPNETLTLTENSPFFEAADQANTVDINKIMKCFDNVPNTGATYQVKLCVDVPDNNNPNELWKLTTKAGHVYVTMTKTNGTQSVTQSFGFYPLNTLSAIEMGPVTSAIVNDGSLNKPHEYNASITMPNIPAGAFQALIAAAKNYSTRNYALSNYNCAGFALDVFNTIRATDINSVYKTDQVEILGVYVSVGFPQSPSGLYEKLANMKNAGGSEAQNIEIGVVKLAAASKGECN